MSSVLKALRQQQSKLLPAQSAVLLEPAARQPRSLLWLAWLAVPFAAIMGWLAVLLLLTPNPPQQPIVATEQQWQLGEPKPVRVVALPAPKAVSEPVVTVAAQPERQQQTQSSFSEPAAVAKDQAVDLNQVPADLLSAFEEAIVATGSRGSQKNSVLPRISDLTGRLQSQIPSFSYDAHQYSSRANERFIELAGKRLRQGDLWQGIQVLTIAPNHVVLALGNDAFQQPALEDWTSSR
ncbi:general secretion pathway protein GspB [Pseudidiomarina sp. E22-M8]|uniref:general secretion pathway protein GspB n=1 Tax=Pseudidiomarina sp. E22-M8 TaxID=3424768 RepID=UPI00403CBDA3